jgi:hypothetical protein
MASIALSRFTQLITPRSSARALAPRAACVRVGRARADYRRRLMAFTAASAGSPARPWTAPRRPERPPHRAAARPAHRMAESSPDELLLRVNRAYGRPTFLTHFVGMASSGALAAGSSLGASWYATGVFTGAVALVLWYVRQSENDHHSEVVEYEMDADVAGVYRKLLAAFDRFSTSGSVWRIEPSAPHSEIAVQRRPRRRVMPRLGLPRRIKSNIVVPMLPGRRRVLCFFPDRLLVYEKQMVWAVPYTDLRVRAGDARTLEDGRDAIPGLNGYLVIEGRAGLRETFRSTDPDAATELASAIHALAC